MRSATKPPPIVLATILTIVESIYVLSINVVWFTSYTSPLLALSSRICRGEVFLDPSYSAYVDVISHGSGYVFAGPLGLPLAISIPMCLLGVGGDPLLVGGAVVSLFGLGSLVLTYRVARLYLERYALASALIVSLGGVLWIYSSHIFPQAAVTFSLLLALYTAIPILRASEGRYRYAILGFSSSLALLMDPMSLLPAISISAVVAIHVARIQGLGGLSRGLASWLAGFAPLALAQAVYNLATVGSPFEFPENLLLERLGVGGLLGLSADPLYGLYMTMVDPRKGLIPLYPVLGLGLALLPWFLRSIPSKYEASVIVTLLLAYLLPHSMWYDFDGGLSYGPRFLAPITPILALPLGLLLGRGSSYAWLAASLAGVSAAMNAVVVTATPYPCALEDMGFPSHQFFECVLPKLLGGFRSSYIYMLINPLTGDPLGTTVSIAVLGGFSIAVIAYTTLKRH